MEKIDISDYSAHLVWANTKKAFTLTYKGVEVEGYVLERSSLQHMDDVEVVIEGNEELTDTDLILIEHYILKNSNT